MKSRLVHLAACIPRSFYPKRSLLFLNINFTHGLIILASSLRRKDLAGLDTIIGRAQGQNSQRDGMGQRRCLSSGLNEMHVSGVPLMAQRVKIQLLSMKMRVQSLVLLSGLRIWHCQELWCRLEMWLGSCVAVAVV